MYAIRSYYGRAVARGRVGTAGRVCVRERAGDQGLETVADPGARQLLAGRRKADRLERAAQAVRDVRCGVDERAVEIDGEQARLRLRQNTRTAISAGAARRSSISLSSLSNVSEAPAIS